MPYLLVGHKIAWRICKGTLYDQIKFGLVVIKFIIY
jgi:hypothetical protein